jgi:serine protease Do
MRSSVTAGLVLLIAGAPLAVSQSGKRNPLIQLSGSIRELTNRVSPAVVEVMVTGYATVDEDKNQAAARISRQNSSGSGVIVDPAGFIMTNAHVVQGAIRVRVLLPAVPQSARSAGSDPVPPTRTVDARLVGIDTESDLALIRIDETGLPALSFGDSDKLRQGDLVFAVGSPMGLSNSVSMGVVSAAARAVNNDNPILYIQTDASINPGNSGGALVDTQGMLIGLNSFIVSSSGGNQGLGFAIPSNVVCNVYQQLRHKGKVSRGTVGLFVQDVSPVLAKGLELPLQRGVVIADVEPNSASDIAGLKRRDIILSLNSHAIDSARQFEDDIYRRQGGEKIALEIQRGSQRLTVSTEVKEQATNWDPLASLASPEKNLVPRLGILCIEINKEVAQLLPDLRRSYGVIVAAKAAQGQAQFVDLQPGDIIHSVNNVPVALLSAFQEMIDGFQRGDAVVLQIERDGKFRFVAFEME